MIWMIFLRTIEEDFRFDPFISQMAWNHQLVVHQEPVRVYPP